MKNVLLLSNISLDNEMLVAYAAQLCRANNAKLHVLHFVDDSRVFASYEYNINNFHYNSISGKKQSIESKLNKLTGDILDKDFVEIAINSGNEKKILDKYLNDNYIDLILIGNTDLYKESFLSVHRDMLFNLVDTPLLAVPDYCVYKPLDDFIFLTTLSSHDIKDVQRLNAIFPDSRVTLLHFTKDIKDKYSLNSKKWLEYAQEKFSGQLTYKTST